MPRRNQRLKAAVHQKSLRSKRGVLERLFVWAFSGLVYPQIWEDPALDMEALERRARGERIDRRTWRRWSWDRASAW